jgi:tetratricopeptide (TPR) repeat protein
MQTLGDESGAVDGLTAAAVREQMEKILASAAFRKSKRLSRFLRFAVDNALSGNEGSLKESVLGIEVFDRGPRFDPRTDPIVRIDARRLRARIAEYYENEGSYDPVRIEFEPGSYVPRFCGGDARRPGPEPKPGPVWRPARSLLVLDLLRQGRRDLDTLTPEGTMKALALFERASAANPEHPLPYAGIAAALLWKTAFFYEEPHAAIPRAKAAAERASRLDPALAEAHGILAVIQALYDYDFAAAKGTFLRALRLDPSHERIQHARAMYFWAPQGMFAEAMEPIRKLLDRHPKCAHYWASLGNLQYFRRSFSESAEALEQSVRLHPRFVFARYRLAQVYERLGRYDLAGAVVEMEDVQTAYPLIPRRAEVMRLAHSGRTPEAAAIVDKMENIYSPGVSDPLIIAESFARIGNADRAFQWLERAYEDRRTLLVFLKSDPAFDTLGGDPRFGDMIARIGLAP